MPEYSDNCSIIGMITPRRKYGCKPALSLTRFFALLFIIPIMRHVSKILHCSTVTKVALQIFTVLEFFVW